MVKNIISLYITLPYFSLITGEILTCHPPTRPPPCHGRASALLGLTTSLSSILPRSISLTTRSLVKVQQPIDDFVAKYTFLNQQDVAPRQTPSSSSQMATNLVKIFRVNSVLPWFLGTTQTPPWRALLMWTSILFLW